MSAWVCELLKCDGCGDQFVFPQEICLYRVGHGPLQEHGIAVLKQPIWCATCNHPTYSERVPTLRELEVAISICGLGDPSRVRCSDDELLHCSVEELITLATGLRDRRQPGRCLWCGGHAYHPLEFMNGRVLRLVHDTCGAPFQHRRSLSGAIGWRVIRWFDLSGGAFLGEEEVVM